MCHLRILFVQLERADNISAVGMAQGFRRGGAAIPILVAQELATSWRKKEAPYSMVLNAKNYSNKNIYSVYCGRLNNKRPKVMVENKYLHRCNILIK